MVPQRVVKWDIDSAEYLVEYLADVSVVMKVGVMVEWKVGYLDDVSVELMDDEKVVW
jgi:hypothetical protein